ncbi:MAG: hypothetical protein GY705_27835 [Bacteroidetes bacterium]|nr:hypothetical protein [Bacteroidota bacterium]
MKNNKGLYTLIGFVLFSLGILSLLLSMIGIHFYFLTFLDIPGKMFGFIMRLLMIVSGVIIVVFTHTDLEQEE